MKPIEPANLAHYVVACRVAGIDGKSTDPNEMRAQIERVAKLSIPDAVRVLRSQ